MKINLNNLKYAIRNPYAWPGGYPTLLVMADGGTICSKCARENYRLIRESMRDNSDSQWQVDSQEVVYENDSGLYCDHCYKVHEAAYTDQGDIETTI